MSQALRLRPRLIWLLVTPVIFAWSAYGAATASGGERLPALAIAISSLLWALYLWVTRIELENGRLAVKRLGEVKSSVRLDALKSWDSYWGGHIPTPTLVIEDTDGNVISLDGLWWAKWSALKELVVAQNAPKADIREDLGPKPVRNTLLLSVGIGLFMGVIATLSLWFFERESWSDSLAVGAAVAVIFAVGVALSPRMNTERPAARSGTERTRDPSNSGLSRMNQDSQKESLEWSCRRLSPTRMEMSPIVRESRCSATNFCG